MTDLVERVVWKAAKCGHHHDPECESCVAALDFNNHEMAELRAAIDQRGKVVADEIAGLSHDERLRRAKNAAAALIAEGRATKPGPAVERTDPSPDHTNPSRDAGALGSYEKFDGVGPHSETIETRARIGERYLEAYESALTDPRLAGYSPADCPSELLLDLLNGATLATPPGPSVNTDTESAA